jgi:uncharacterized protein (DUF1499 family)
MLRTFAIALLATAMSVGVAHAKGHKAAPKASLPQCQTEQQAKAKCACGPAKVACPAGMWCHAFVSACTR